MNEYLFGVTSEKLTKAEGRRRDKIARQHGGTFIGPVSIPGNRSTGWFAIDNLGHPHNARRSTEILSACGL
jgi:hypothetical protein